MTEAKLQFELYSILRNVRDLREIQNLRIIFEVSFKGVNKEQFAWLANRDPELFRYQCAGFEKLWKMKSNNIDVIAELGINHCDKVNKYPKLGVRIIDENGSPPDFTKYDNNFKKKF